MDKILLFPYWLTLKIRHMLFDNGFRKVYEPAVPSICIGNITVGGTGKTPHTEMLVRTLLEDEQWYGKNIAVLSRGYKRRSKGFQQVVADGRALDYGDEPLQIKKKFPMVTVAVDSSRKEGCTFLTAPEAVKTSKKGRRCIHKDFPKADLILLDDAFQHRYVRPGINILLMDYNRPIYEDALMPTGLLREPASSIYRAQIIIVTKCPKDIKPIDFRIVAKHLELRPYQQMFFTSFTYGNLNAFNQAEQHKPLSALTANTHIVLVTGIASATPLVEKLNEYTANITHLEYRDHHDFKHSDLQQIENVFSSINAEDKLIITTEKDAARLRGCKLSENISCHLYVLPIEIEFLQDQQEIFNNYITDYVSKNSRNRIVHQRADAHKS